MRRSSPRKPPQGHLPVTRPWLRRPRRRPRARLRRPPRAQPAPPPPRAGPSPCVRVMHMLFALPLVGQTRRLGASSSRERNTRVLHASAARLGQLEQLGAPRRGRGRDGGRARGIRGPGRASSTAAARAFTRRHLILCLRLNHLEYIFNIYIYIGPMLYKAVDNTPQRTSCSSCSTMKKMEPA